MYYWIEEKNCQLSTIDLCRSRHPNQLLKSEVKTIKEYLLNDNFRNWSVLSVYYQALRDQTVFMGIGTWYKYARRLGIRRKFFRLNHKKKIGIRASKPLQIFHMDVTIFRPLDNTKVYIYLLIDNFSRYILGWKARREFSSSIGLEILKGSIEKYNINFHSRLVVDGGPENEGQVSKFISTNDKMVKLVAQKDIIQSNSMVESVNKHIKYYYLFKSELKDLKETSSYLLKSIPDYNHKPHGALFGLTPFEVLNGEIPSRDKFTEEKLEARKNRLIMNQKVECCERN